MLPPKLTNISWVILAYKQTVGALPQTPPKALPLETAKGALPPWIPIF